jgi:hypothetical protein
VTAAGGAAAGGAAAGGAAGGGAAAGGAAAGGAAAGGAAAGGAAAGGRGPHRRQLTPRARGIRVLGREMKTDVIQSIRHRLRLIIPLFTFGPVLLRRLARARGEVLLCFGRLGELAILSGSGQ